ncbi:MAG: M20/M25/M40 family metallo-hydrolase [Acidimicrobiia bacterium]|nr:M20/M25/M40 family metallo-hydrolase [Acidimicrobiia bacterium]
MSAVDPLTLTDRVGRTWERDILPALAEYIAIPNESPLFAPDWDERGDMAHAVALVRDWCASRPIEGATVAVRALAGRTPVVVVEVPAWPATPGEGVVSADTVLLYGHLDKQPAMTGWDEGLGPWTPVRRGEKLYGRGGADDGYAAFASLTAIEAVRAAGGSHARCVLLIEASEESGSPDLPAHVEALADRIGSPSLVVCLDSGCATYDRLWVTTSLRGLVGATVTVDVLTEGVHSGGAGGVVPSSFRVLRALLERIEDATTGELLLPELHGAVPADRAAQLETTAAELGARPGAGFPVIDGLVVHADGDAVAQLRARTWAPALAYIGIDGVPPMSAAGNVLRPRTAVKLSFRLAPTVDSDRAAAAIEAALSRTPPHGAHVTVDVADRAAGWNAPPFDPWLEEAVRSASETVYGRPARMIGEGGSIPFMAMLGERFPAAQFLVTGVLGPGSNAHGPNEFLHVPYATKLTGAVAHVLDAHARR